MTKTLISCYRHMSQSCSTYILSKHALSSKAPDPRFCSQPWMAVQNLPMVYPG